MPKHQERESFPCAQVESEIAELDADGVVPRCSKPSACRSQHLKNSLGSAPDLGLHSYFTAGEKEVRAWTIPIGATAPQAAGVIHSDFERGFIRAEVYSVDDLVTYKSEKEIRNAGKLRVEGKSYVMRDGDVCHFLFNV
ncbi:MAG: DUF933 domain-containing protein [Pirellulaceae bacterium]